MGGTAVCYYRSCLARGLFKKILHLVAPCFALRAVLRAAFGGQLFEIAQHVLLLLGKLDRGLDGHVAEQVAREAGTNALDALALEAEGLARLGAFGDRERYFTRQRRHFD